MKWRRIPKENATQPSRGKFGDWKQQLAEEGFHQCVYCAIPDAVMGGTRNFHIEHYRPKSRFPDLENTITNLFYACPICNTFKGNDWPAEPDHEVQCYPDPSVSDYDKLFTINETTGEILGTYIASRYMVEKIHLNRGQLILERRLEILLSKERTLRSEISRLIKKLPNEKKVEPLTRYSNIVDRMLNLMEQLRIITPYQPHDVQRP